MTNNNTIYDFAGIGIGPFNLGLACLTEPIEELNGIFFDANEGFNWHPGMLLESTTLQIPFLADMVTLADPTSPFSFLNYIKEQGRIYSFYIRENFLLLRNEYNQYCQWVTKKLTNLHFNTRVDRIDYDTTQQCYIITTIDTKSGTITTAKAKRLVLGTGTPPHLPECSRHLSDKVVHSAHYLDHKKELQSRKSISVIGSGQSAAEIFYDLLQSIDEYGYELNWITNSPRFFPMEYSKLTLEMTSPDYVDYFFGLPADKRDMMNKKQKNLYKGINISLIDEIYNLLYTKRLTNDIKVSLRTNSLLQQLDFNNQTQQFELVLHQHEQDKHYSHKTEGLVMATGYGYNIPEFLEGVSSRINMDAKGRFDVQRNYSIDQNNSEIFVQNVELHTHGFVTPDLGMTCYRNSYIIKEMTGKDYYKIENRIAFQQFEVSAEEEIVRTAAMPV